MAGLPRLQKLKSCPKSPRSDQVLRGNFSPIDEIFKMIAKMNNYDFYGG